MGKSTHFYYTVLHLHITGPYDSYGDAETTGGQVLRLETSLSGIVSNPCFMWDVDVHLWFIEKYSTTEMIERFISAGNNQTERGNVVWQLIQQEVSAAETNQGITQDIMKWLAVLQSTHVITGDLYHKCRALIFPADY